MSTSLSTSRKYAPKKDLVDSAPKEGDKHLLNVIAIPMGTGDNAAGITSAQLSSILTAAEAGDTQDQARLIDFMCEKDPLLGGLFETRKHGAASSNWHIFEQEDGRFTDQKNPKVAEFESHLRRVGLDDAILHLFDFVKFGYAGVVNKWGSGGVIEGFKPIHHTAWSFDEAGFPALDSADGATIPLSDFHPNQFTLVKNTHPEANPCRCGVGRLVAWSWFLKHRNMPPWMRFIEKFGQPFIVVKMSQADYDNKEKREALLKHARKAAVDGSFATKALDDTGVHLLSAQDNSIHEKLAKFIDRQNTIRILGQLGSSEGEPGRLGNSDAQATVSNEKREFDCRMMMCYVQRQIVEPAWRWMYGEATPAPFFMMDYNDPKDLKYKAEVLTTMDMRLWRPSDAEVQQFMGIGFVTYKQEQSTDGEKTSTPLKTREKKVADKTKE